MSELTPQLKAALREKLIDHDAGRHICDNEGTGCEIEEFKGEWPGVIRVYYRCKQEREYYDETMRIVESAIQPEIERLELAARIDELFIINREYRQNRDKSLMANPWDFKSLKMIDKDLDFVADRIKRLTQSNQKEKSHES